jgi:hypothetical protein
VINRPGELQYPTMYEQLCLLHDLLKQQLELASSAKLNLWWGGGNSSLPTGQYSHTGRRRGQQTRTYVRGAPGPRARAATRLLRPIRYTDSAVVAFLPQVAIGPSVRTLCTELQCNAACTVGSSCMVPAASRRRACVPAGLVDRSKRARRRRASRVCRHE